MAKAKQTTQTLDELTDRFRDLETQKTVVQTRLETTKERLEELLAEAEREFGTRDLDELEAKLKELESENLEKRKTYQKSLDTIEQQLAQIAEQFVDVTVDEEE